MLPCVCLCLWGCRQRMADQPKLLPLQASQFFADGRDSRPLVPGTIPVGHFRDNSVLFTGRIGKTDTTTIPIQLTREVLDRGRERFNIFCSSCHGRLGDGDGMIVARGFTRPPSFTDDRLLTSPAGHIYDAMTNGFGRMPDYATQIPPRDRWAITGYVRALQLSQHATLKDVPEVEKKKLLAEGGAQ